MSANTIFDPEKMALIDFKMIKGQIETPENFEINNVSGHQIEHSLELAFNLEDNLAKSDFTIKIQTNSNTLNTEESTGMFHLVFIYRIENLDALYTKEKDEKIVIDPGLAGALTAVTYSTSRGILLTRLQGTALQTFVLPIINANKLLHNKSN